MANKSSQQWLKEHFTDSYVKKAQQLGYRSRAAFKLLEIQERDHLFKSGMTVIDLGAAPGGWSQLVAKFVKSQGKVIALDLLPMDPIPNVAFIQNDFSIPVVIDDLINRLAGAKADWVLSDMSPNISGNASVDIPQSIYLAELVVDFALKVLHKDGGVLIKVFQGSGFEQLLSEVRQQFTSVFIRKPKASRNRSREVYILATRKRSVSHVQNESEVNKAGPNFTDKE